MIFRLASPWMLLAALPCVAAAWLLLRRRRNSDARLRLPMVTSRLAVSGGLWVTLDRMLPWLRGLALLLLVVALARPQSGARIEDVSTLGVDIAVSLDVSGSMIAEDLAPGKTRLAVARETVRRFIDGRPNDRIGLVVFAGLAATRCPLTQDHEMLGQFLERVDFAPKDQDGTALGMGLATAVNRLRDSDAKSKVVVLATDGVNNAGQIGPRAAAEAARALAVKVYTIGVGSEDGWVQKVDTFWGPREVQVPTQLDEDLLGEIAELTGGRYFRAGDAEAMESIFATIDELEKTRIESQVRVLYSELFPLLLIPAVALLLLERSLVATRLRRIP